MKSIFPPGVSKLAPHELAYEGDTKIKHEHVNIVNRNSTLGGEF